MNEIAEELKQKLKMGWLSKKKNLVKTTGHRLHVVARPNGHIVMNFKSSDQYLHVVSQQEWKGDELTFIFQGTATELLTVKDKIRQKTGKATKVNFLLESDHFPTSKLPTIWLHFDGGSLMPIRLHRRQQDFLVVEETSKMVTDLKNVADDVSPATSFSYLVDKLLAGE